MITSTRDNALDSIRRTARAAAEVSGEDALSSKGALSWGWHAVAMLAYTVLQPARERFDAWFWDYLESGETELETERDARWEERRRLSLLELLDVLSAEDAFILRPEFYQGWQDRRVRCRTLRRQATEVVGGAIGDEERDELLFLLAAYHRLLRMPAAVDLDPAAVRRALPHLVDLMELLARAAEDPEEILDAVEECRKALS